MNGYYFQNEKRTDILWKSAIWMELKILYFYVKWFIFCFLLIFTNVPFQRLFLFFYWISSQLTVELTRWTLLYEYVLSWRTYVGRTCFVLWKNILSLILPQGTSIFPVIRVFIWNSLSIVHPLHVRSKMLSKRCIKQLNETTIKQNSLQIDTSTHLKQYLLKFMSTEIMK